jgi:tetratricopeptide (TPR) repeat protein
MQATYPLERSAVLAKLGAVLLARGVSEEAEALIEAAVEVGRMGPGPGHPSLIFPLEQLAEVRLAQGRHQEAETAAREALAIQEGSGHFGAAGRAEALASLGGVLLVRGQAEAAEAVLAEALALQEAIYPAGSPLTAATRERLERARANVAGGG